MTSRKNPRIKRQEKLKKYLEENPFTKDDELAEHFHVSVATIRLDRMVLKIPEVRERVKNVATKAVASVRSLNEGEIVGKLLDLEVGKQATSELSITSQMVLEKSKVARGHYLFAQANSLAVSMIDADVVLTGGARLRYKRMVCENEVIIAKAVVKVKRSNAYLISVYSYVGEEIVFKSQIILLVK